MRLMVSGATRTVDALADTDRARHHLGRLYVPAGWNVINTNLPWACDNGAFSGFDESAFLVLAMKARDAMSGGGMRWITCPDVVADAAATLELFGQWEYRLHTFGLPLAFVAQDGLTEGMVPWDRIVCLFIGGSTEFKKSPDAFRLAHEAKRRGKMVHVGRVNSYQRIRSWFGLADSCDGSKFSRFPDTYIPDTLWHLDRLSSQEVLPL